MVDEDDLDPKRLVAESYDEIAERHAAWAERTRTDERKRYADILLRQVPQGGELLDLGCGTGGSTTNQLAEHFRLTGVDASRRSIVAARERVPKGRFICADMAVLEFPAASFDAVAAFYSISHLPRAEHGALLRKIAGWLRPGGLFVGTMGVEEIEAAYDEAWLGAPMYWSSFDSATNLRLVAEAGLVISSANEETAEEDGRPITFLWVVAQKRSDSSTRPSMKTASRPNTASG